MRLLIAEDHPISAQALSEVLRRCFAAGTPVRRVVHSGDEYLDALEGGERFDLIVQDLRMPGRIRGIELLKAARRIAPDSPVLVHSASDGPCVMRAALDAGARGFVGKGSGWEKLREAAIAVMAGDSYLDPAVDFAAAMAHPWFDLTPSEREVVLWTAKGAKSRDLCARSGRAYTTVTTHKANALRKLGLRSDGELAAYIYEQGLDYEFDALGRVDSAIRLGAP